MGMAVWWLAGASAAPMREGAMSVLGGIRIFPNLASKIFAHKFQPSGYNQICLSSAGAAVNLSTVLRRLNQPLFLRGKVK